MKLFKYVPLRSENDAAAIKYNDERFRSLALKKAWLSTFSHLNDPFEAYATACDSNAVTVGETNKLMNFIIKYQRSKFIVYSLSQNSYNSLPMWAHYANNHEGFCVEYDYLDNSNKGIKYECREVIYSDERLSADRQIEELSKCNSYCLTTGKYTFPFSENWKEFIIRNNSTKHSSWAYENEWRILYIAVSHERMPEDMEAFIASKEKIQKQYEELEKDGGRLIDIADIGLRISKIYAGMNCSDNNVKMLNRISHSLGCGNIHKITGINCGTNFKLSTMEVLYGENS